MFLTICKLFLIRNIFPYNLLLDFKIINDSERL